MKQHENIVKKSKVLDFTTTYFNQPLPVQMRLTRRRKRS